MKLLIASDQGRLSRHALLSDIVTEIPLLPKDQDGFLQTLKTYGDPYVLFWHDRAEAVLELLGNLTVNNFWPPALSAVVLFRGASYAGFDSREHSDAAIDRSRIPRSKIHILSIPVSSHPDAALISRIRRFAEALNAGSAIVPCWLLEPEDYGDAVFTLLVIERLASAGWNCPREILDHIDWTPVVQKCASLGIPFPSQLSIGAVKGLARALRQSLAIALEAPCRPCRKRSVWAHTDLEVAIPLMEEPRRTQALAQACAQIGRFLNSASDISADIIKTAIERVDIGCRDHIASPLAALVAYAAKDQCALAGGAHRVTAALLATETNLAAGRDSAELARTLAKALACDRLSTVSLDHDVTADFNY